MQTQPLYRDRLTGVEQTFHPDIALHFPQLELVVDAAVDENAAEQLDSPETSDEDADGDDSDPSAP